MSILNRPHKLKIWLTVLGVSIAVYLLPYPLRLQRDAAYVPIGGILLMCAGEGVMGTLFNPILGWATVAAFFCWLYWPDKQTKQKP